MKIALLGSTGSIGVTAIQVAKHLDYPIVAMAAHSNEKAFVKQIEEHKPEVVALYDKGAAARLRMQFPHLTILEGEEGIAEVAAYESAQVVLMAISGMAALAATLSAIKAGKRVALANKEVLVAGGKLITEMAKRYGALLLPVDSEHSAIFQCMQKIATEELGRIILTASGGPFRNFSQQELSNVTKAQALNHPVWKMGQKITVDSSTLMNKALEMIEAYWFFGKIPEVVIHPTHVIHSMIETIDGSVFAQMNEPDMCFPIQYALTYPKRVATYKPPFDFAKNSRMEFYAVDTARFPAISFAKEALLVGGSLPAYLNGANETLVARFLQEKISWWQINQKLQKLLEKHRAYEVTTLEDVLAAHNLAQQEALTI